jgi:hypothetical protein
MIRKITVEGSSPLELYLDVWRSLFVAAFHGFCVMGVLAPARDILILGQPVSSNALLLPISYSCLVILYLVYGLHLATRLAAIGACLFTISVSTVIALNLLPAAAGDTSRGLHGVPVIMILVIVGFAFSAGNASVVGLFHLMHRVPRNQVVIWAGIIAIPMVAYTIATVLARLLYQWQVAPLPTTWQDTARRILILALYVALYSPLVYYGARFVQRRVKAQEQRVAAAFLAYAQRLAVLDAEAHLAGQPGAQRAPESR